VTGGAGFIGSHLCDRLLEVGHTVVAVDDLSLGRRQFIEHLADRTEFTFCETSILDPVFDDLMAQGKFDRVFHFAANSDIQAGSADRQVDLDKTFLTTYRVCESMARHSVPELIFASTSAVYGAVEEATDEDFGPLVPVSFYGAAKLASEAYCAAYAHRHDILTWVFRFPNVIGPRATHGVLYDFVRKLKRNPNVLDVLGDGSQEKPYLYVHDLLDAILLAVDRAKPSPYEIFNIGPETATRVMEIAETVVDVMGLRGNAEIRYGVNPWGWPGDVPRFAYSLDKIHKLGWRARCSSDEAVRRAAMDVVDELHGV
jgi:UDP-glucose 4-epimerase